MVTGMNRKTAHVILGCVLALLAAASIAIARGYTISPQEIVRRKTEALARGGLHEAAKITGTFIGHTRLKPTNTPASIEELVGGAQAVVVGVATSNAGHITPNGRNIYSEFRFTVSDVLKGYVGATTVEVLIPGGRVEFDDGRWAQVNVPGFTRPLANRRYLLLLKRAPGNVIKDQNRLQRTAFVPIAGGLGVFELGQQVKPSGGLDVELGRTLARGRHSEESFLRLIRQRIGAQ